MRPTFGQVSHMVLMNLDTWNGLDDATREEIQQIAVSFESEANTIFDGLAEKERTALEAEGMEETALSEELAAKLQTAWFEGALDLAATKNPDEIANIRKLAAEAGVD